MTDLIELEKSIWNFITFKPRFGQSTHKEIEKHSKKLEVLNLEIQESENKLYKNIDLENLFNKFIQSIKDKKEVSLKNSELRAIAYNFGYRTENESSLFDSNKLVVDAFLTLNDSWKNVYYFGLFESVLKNWHCSDKNILKQLITIYLKKIKKEKEPSLRLKKIIESVPFINPDTGEKAYANWLTSNEIPYTNIALELGLKKSDLRLDYFANVLIEYAKLNYYSIKEQVFSNYELTQLFELHPNKDVHKLIVAHLVVHPNSETKKDELKKIAYRVFGDTKSTSNWRLTSFLDTSENMSIIYDARYKLDYWITQSFITVFFEKCIRDDDRRRFWLQYSKQVDDVKIVGDNMQMYKLRFNGIDDYLEQRFIRTRSNDSNLAIVMEIKNYQIIEFSERGAALYVYLKSGRNSIKFANAKIYSSISDLKKTHISLLFNKTGNYYQNPKKEGRLTHVAGWETPLAHWIQYYIGV